MVAEWHGNGTVVESSHPYIQAQGRGGQRQRETQRDRETYRRNRPVLSEDALVKYFITEVRQEGNINRDGEEELRWGKKP